MARHENNKEVISVTLIPPTTIQSAERMERVNAASMTKWITAQAAKAPAPKATSYN